MANNKRISTPSAATKAKGAGWTRALRERLSAIRVPRKTDPPDFYLDADAAWARLGGTGSPPAQLTQAGELQRIAQLERDIGKSWSQKQGRNFSNDFFNPLIALWVAREGWNFVFDIVLEPHATRSWLNRTDEWIAVRRYLSRATAEEYAVARARVEPRFELVRESAEMDDRDLRDLIAFAFLRDPWADEVMRAYLNADGEDARHKAPHMKLIAAASQDTDLVLAAAEKYGGSVGHAVYYVFDIVEAHGANAVKVLERVSFQGADDRKRLEKAIAVAMALADEPSA